MSHVPEKPSLNLTREIPFGHFRSEKLPYASNAIVTRKYTVSSTLGQVMVHAVLAGGYWWLFAVCAAEVLLAQQGWVDGQADLVVVAVAVALAVTAEVFQEYQRISLDRRTNTSLCRLWDGDDFVETPRGSVLCGDLLLVSNGESVAADVVLFATEHPDGFCYVDNSQALGSAELEMKHSVPDVQRIVESASVDRLSSALTRLNGMLRTSPPSQDFQSFAGQLRLARSPAAVSLSMKNFVLRGSCVFGSGWVIGCVVATGMETKVMLNAKSALHVTTRLEATLYKYTLIAIVFSSVLLLSNLAGLLITLPDQPSLLWQTLYSFLQLHRLVPATLFLTFQVVKLLQTALINGQRSAHELSLSLCALPAAFGHVHYIVADKNAAFTRESPHVHTIIFRDKLFGQCTGYAEGSHTCVEMMRRHKNPGVVITDGVPMCGEKRPSSDANERTYASVKSQSKAMVVDDLEESCGFRALEAQLAAESEDVIRLFECMVLCNTVTQLDPLKAKNKFEQALILCGGRFGFHLLEATADSALLEIYEKRIIYKTLASSEYSKSLKRMRVVTDRSDAPYGMLYVKGAIEALGPLLDIDDELFEHIRAVALEVKRVGLVPIMLACKTIPEDQLEDLKDQISKAQSSIINIRSKIETILSTLERGLQYLGIACIDDTISDDIADGVFKLAKAGVKLWLVSNDSETETLASCMRTGFFDEEGYIVPVRDVGAIRDCARLLRNLVTEFIYHGPLQGSEAETPISYTNPKALRHASLEKLWSEIAGTDATARREDYREVLARPFNPKGVNFAVIMDGGSFDTALQEEDTQRLLAALLFASKVVCFYSMLPHQKAKVVRFLRHSFSFSPSVLVYAHGLSCFPMLNEADLKVGLPLPSESYLYDGSADSLDTLSEFLVTEGRNSNRRVRFVVGIVLHENAMVVTAVMLYAGLCAFTSTSPIDLVDIWLLTLVATKPLTLYLGLLTRDIPQKHCLHHPEIYRWRSSQLSIPILLKSLSLAVVEGGVVFALFLLSVGSAITERGYTENAEVMSAGLTVLLFAAEVAHAVAMAGDWSVKLVGAVLASCTVFVFSVLLVNYTDSSLSYYLTMCFSFPPLAATVLTAPLAVYALSLALSSYSLLFRDKFITLVQHSASVQPLMHRYSNSLWDVWTPSKVWAAPKSGDIFERNRFLRTYKLRSLEDNYQVSLFPEVIRYIQTSFCLLAMTCLACTAEAVSAGYAVQYNPLRALACCFCAVIFALAWTKAYKNHYAVINLCSLLVLSTALALYEVLSGNSSSEVAIALPIVSFLSFYVTVAKVAVVTAVNVAVFLLIGVFNVFLPASDSVQGLLDLAGRAVDVVGVAAMAGVAGYFLDDINREKFQLLTTQENELEKADNVLKYLLPDFVRARVKDGVRFIAEVQPCVHILFCEICGFDQIIRDYDAVEVISLLNSIYEKFDELCELCGVTKVETVGKVYMACVGVKESEQDLKAEVPRVSQAHRLLFFAFELIAATEQFRLADGAPVKIKVGMHSGKVIAGVVGYHKPQFSLVGDTVNTASRMCSTVEAENTVQMSESTYSLLKDTYGVHFDHSTKSVKGKGMMDVYTVWRDSAPGEYKVELEAPDVSPLSRMSSSRKSIHFARAMTVVRRDSVFEANAEVVRNFQKKLHRKGRKWWRCFFRLPVSDSKHYSEILELKKRVGVTGLAVSCLLMLVDLSIHSVQLALGYQSWSPLLVDASTFCLLAALLALSRKWFTAVRFSWAATTVLSAVVACAFLDVWLQDGDNFSGDMVNIVVAVIAAVHFTGMQSSQLLPFISAIGGIAIAAFLMFRDQPEYQLRLGCLLGELCIFFLSVLYRDVRLHKYFELKAAVTAEIEKTDNLLLNLLPQHILDSMKLEKAIIDRLEDTTLLVADIVGFTAWSNEREPSEVIEMLSNMFTEFDKLCLVYKTYKVYTIGDCYIAMGFSGKHDYRDPKQECLNVVLMAMEMKKVIDKVNDDYFTNLNMRIGVHTGEVIGGVAGTNIVRYDIYGRDVVIAFKMEANSQPGRINLSAAAKSFLEEAAPESFTFTPNSVVDIAAIDTSVTCYFTELAET